MQADVTVIMQNYNASMNKLRDAVYSVINQSFERMAFIFIDDWSTDYDISYFFDEIKKAWNYKRPNMPLHLIKKPQSGPMDPRVSNHGHSFCRNWGLDLIRNFSEHTKLSDFVFFADSDDELLPNCIEILWNNMQQDDEIDISIGNFTRDNVKWINERDRAYRIINDIEEYKFPDAKTVNNLQGLKILCDPYMVNGHRITAPSVPFCATWNKIFRLSLFDDVQFPDYRTKDDNFTAHRLIWNSRKIVFTPMITYFYRPGGNLADKNLYKTIDIVDAHADRIKFFNKIFKDDIDNTSEITLENFKDKILINRIIADERLVYLHTLMTVYSTCIDKRIRIRCIAEFKNYIQLWKKDLIAYEPKFLEQCLVTEKKMLSETAL